MSFTRVLKYKAPMQRGDDVVQVQRRLLSLGYVMVGEPDGKFGAATRDAVEAFQQDNALKVDGIVGTNTWKVLFATAPPAQTDKLSVVLPSLTAWHRFRDSVRWRLQRQGLEVEGSGFERTGGEPTTVRRVWDRFGYAIDRWGERYNVPAELIVATMCTETSGDPTRVREEPGYISDTATPNKVSPGLMQTLISTAVDALDDPTITREWLLDPSNSIRAGTAYIASQWRVTNFDPPKVGAAYNAGSVYHNDNEENRWKMRQYPIGTAEHVDRFVKWFNDFYAIMADGEAEPQVTFFTLLT